MPAPQFVMMHRQHGDEQSSGSAAAAGSTNNQRPNRSPEQVGQHIEGIVNELLGSFLGLFGGRDFARMQGTYDNFNPNSFMNNFNSNFASDDLFEMIRRISEEEAQRQQRSKRAKKEAVERLPIIKITDKHCKKMADGKVEPPTCTICCDHIEKKTEGMFMPCGHIYHPDCLKPWLETKNTCPVCRFDLPLEEPEK